MNKISFNKAANEARERFLRDCIGVGFQDGRGDWVRIASVDSEGRVFLQDAVTSEPTFIVERSHHSDLVALVAQSAEGKGDQGYSFLVPGEGDRLVIDWPRIVLFTGYRVHDLLVNGISWCIMNPRRSADAWS